MKNRRNLVLVMIVVLVIGMLVNPNQSIAAEYKILAYVEQITALEAKIKELEEKISTLEKNEKAHHTLVAHAGGSIYGYKYTNSLEALEQAYNNGFKLIEMDFQWTSDDKIVCIHDWESMVRRLFMINSRPLNLYEFKNYNTFQDLTLIDIDDIANWLREKDDVYIITDMKGDNIKFLKTVAESYKDIQNRFIPQIYSIEEYDPVKEMGYEDIILTLYRTYYTDTQIVNFAKDHDLFAITMAAERAQNNLPNLLKDIGVLTYAHTINELYEFENLQRNGIHGIYTDYFQPNNFIK